jgi:hypothetical protein
VPDKKSSPIEPLVEGESAGAEEDLLRAGGRLVHSTAGRPGAETAAPAADEKLRPVPIVNVLTKHGVEYLVMGS